MPYVPRDQIDETHERDISKVKGCPHIPHGCQRWGGLLEKMKRLELSGGLSARNTVLNFIGQAVLLLVGAATVPFIVREAGNGALSVRVRDDEREV